MLSELVGEIRRVREQISTTQRELRGAQAQLAEAVSAYATITEGSVAPAADEIATCLKRAGEHVSAGLSAAARSEQLAASYLVTVMGGTPPDPPASATGSARATLPAHVRHAAKVRDAQARIGRGVRGSETRGAWLGSVCGKNNYGRRRSSSIALPVEHRPIRRTNGPVTRSWTTSCAAYCLRGAL